MLLKEGKLSTNRVLVCYLVHLHSAGSCFLLNVSSRECVPVDKHSVKIDPCDKTRFPISWPWTGEPWSPCLTKTECEAVIVPTFIIMMCCAHIKPTSYILVSYKRHIGEIDVLAACWILAFMQRRLEVTTAYVSSVSTFSIFRYLYVYVRTALPLKLNFLPTLQLKLNSMAVIQWYVCHLGARLFLNRIYGWCLYGAQGY